MPYENATNFKIIQEAMGRSLSDGRDSMTMLIGVDSNAIQWIKAAGIDRMTFEYDPDSIAEFTREGVHPFGVSTVLLTAKKEDAVYREYIMVQFDEKAEPSYQCCLIREEPEGIFVFAYNPSRGFAWKRLGEICGRNEEYMQGPGTKAAMEAIADACGGAPEIINPDKAQDLIEDSRKLIELYEKTYPVAMLDADFEPDGSGDLKLFLVPADGNRMGGAVMEEHGGLYLCQRLCREDVVKLCINSPDKDRFSKLAAISDEYCFNGKRAYPLWQRVCSAGKVRDMEAAVMDMWDHSSGKDPLLCLPVSKTAWISSCIPYESAKVHTAGNELTENEKNVIRVAGQTIPFLETMLEGCGKQEVEP